MHTIKIGGEDYLKMVKAGATRLNADRKEINDLNVFPIPDGDTGDNMYMTIRSGCDSMNEGISGVGELASDTSRGMLFGARGNSGVILSRIFAGIAKGLGSAEVADLQLWKSAMQEAVNESYKSVAIPVEGTILTVFKDAVRAANGSGTETFEEYFDVLCSEASRSLDRTPELLPVLKEAGVVDSGGAGLVHILEGMKAALEGEAPSGVEGGQEGGNAGKIDLDAFTEDSELTFGYCTEFLLRLQTVKVGDVASFDESVIRDWLMAVGESLVFIRDGSIIKVHVHTKTPGDILTACQKWGEFLKIKVENMTLQHHENNMDKKVFKGPRRKRAIVAVASGEGIVNVLKDTGADFVIEGGQTMNPSTDSFIEAFDMVNADLIYVLPNNSNIILTAKQAAGLYPASDVRVIATKSIGAGYAVLGSVDFSANDAGAVVAEAEEIASTTVTGMVSKAIRDTRDAVKGDYIGFSGGEILCDSSDRSESAVELCRKLNAGNSDVILLFKGADVPQDEADALNARLQAEFRSAEVVICDGGQPIFDYIIILE